MAGCLARCRRSEGCRRTIPRRSSAAILASGAMVVLSCLVSPNAASARQWGERTAAHCGRSILQQKPKRAPAKRIAASRAVSNRGTGRNNQPAQEAPVAGAGANPRPQATLDRKMQGFDQSRDHILTKLGATSYTITGPRSKRCRKVITTPVDKLVLQFPGVNYNSAASKSQFPCPRRIRQRPDPDQRSCPAGRRLGLGPVIDTSFHRAACRC